MESPHTSLWAYAIPCESHCEIMGEATEKPTIDIALLVH